MPEQQASLPPPAASAGDAPLATGPPPDQAARDRVRDDLGSTLFVEAGAGSGKTTALVGRVLALITTGEAELASIAAITFTEKAASELRYRVRDELAKALATGLDSTAAQRCRTALGQLDTAAIGTLHSFARRILSEHPIEAGLPPRIDVLDEVSSNIAFQQRWAAFQDELLADAGIARTLLLFFAAGARPLALRYLAKAFEENWDLVHERVPASAPAPPDVRNLLQRAVHLVAEVVDEPCHDTTDRLRARVDQVAARFDTLMAINDELELVEALDLRADPKWPSFQAGNLGRAGSWADVQRARRKLSEVGHELERVKSAVAQDCARQVGSWVRTFTLSAAEERRTAGALQFHDLLVLARALLRHPRHGPVVRSQLRSRYRRLLLDEFQDTDPIQIELAVLIAAEHPDARDLGDRAWTDVDVSPGRLFMVGDPKQSIYRFRRADISVFIAAAQRFGGTGRVELTANFRAGAPIIDWVNTTFGRLMGQGATVAGGLASQPAYIPLSATRPAPPGGPPVSVLGRQEHPNDVSADDMRSAEAAEVARAIATIAGEGWLVGDGQGGWRPARLGDITVLVPARTSLPFLEDALEGAGVPFRAESSSLVYASRAVRDLLMVLRAVDDPTNYLYIVSALRTPLLACGDDDLFRFYRERKGHWSYLADQPPTVPSDDPVLLALGYLQALYDQRGWLAPSELLGLIVRDRRAFELAFAAGRPRDLWRQLRFVIDQARAWADATGGNLRQYLAWVRDQSSEGGRVAEAVLPETDDDAVRIMTVHAAKGLEFPVTVVSGMSTAPHQHRAPAQVVFPPGGGVGYRFSGDVTTEEYDSWKPVDEQMGFHERERLLYVACTRARDHLVVSLHRRQRRAATTEDKLTNAELLVLGMDAALSELPDVAGPPAQLRPVVVEPPAPPPPYEQWWAELSAALDKASQPRTVAATALTDEGGLDPESDPDPGLRKRPRDMDLPPWLKGRYGNEVGRAVHGVLQTVDLSTGADLDALVAAQCEAEAVPGRRRTVRDLVLLALGAAPVRAAAAARHWREVYVCANIGGRLLEGYIDLLYRSAEGLVVLDYKTAATSEPGHLDARALAYRNQGASYALALESVTGEKVAKVTFLFLTPQGAVERDIPDLAEAVRHVGRMVADGRELLAD